MSAHPDERCFRANETGKLSPPSLPHPLAESGRTQFVDFVFPRGYIFLATRALRVCTYVCARARVCFFSFLDENVMSEVEIVGATRDCPSDARIESGQTRVTKL